MTEENTPTPAAATEEVKTTPQVEETVTTPESVVEEKEVQIPLTFEDLVDVGDLSVVTVRRWESGDTVLAGSHTIEEIELQNTFEDGNMSRLFAIFVDGDLEPFMSLTSIFSDQHAGFKAMITSLLGIQQSKAIISEGLVASSLAQKALDLVANRYQPYFMRAKKIDEKVEGSEEVTSIEN